MNPEVVRFLEKAAIFVFGAIFVTVLLVLAHVFPEPSPFTYEVTKVILALSVSYVATLLSGFLKIEIGGVQAPIPAKIKAGGAFAVFVIVYFFSPADLVVPDIDKIKITDRIKSDLRNGELDNARKKAQAAIKRFPDSAVFHNLLGTYYVKSKNYEEAQTYFSKAVIFSKDAEKMDFDYNLAFTHTMPNNPAEAIKLYRKLHRNAVRPISYL